MNASDALKTIFVGDEETGGIHNLINLAKTSLLDLSLRKQLLANGLDRLNDLSPRLHAESFDELNRMLDSRRSGLHMFEIWKTLNLPASIFERFREMQAKVFVE